MLHRLYSYGYSKGKIRDLHVLTGQGALILDVRYNPFARFKLWNRDELSERFGSQYRWCRDLGNENYKGGTIQLANEEAGLTKLAQLLFDQPVVLLCACAEACSCHRHTIIEKMTQRHTELCGRCFHLPPNTDLNLDPISEEAEATPPPAPTQTVMDL